MREVRLLSTMGLRFALGIEGSANKIGVGIVREDGRVDDGARTAVEAPMALIVNAVLSVVGEILANVRKTYISPPGHGFLPKETAKHHQDAVVGLIRSALDEAQLATSELTCIAYTKGTELQLRLPATKQLFDCVVSVCSLGSRA